MPRSRGVARGRRKGEPRTVAGSARLQQHTHSIQDGARPTLVSWFRRNVKSAALDPSAVISAPRFRQQRAAEGAINGDAKIVVRLGEGLRLGRIGAAVADIDPSDGAPPAQQRGAGAAGAPAAIDRKLADAVRRGFDDTTNRAGFGTEMSR